MALNDIYRNKVRRSIVAFVKKQSDSVVGDEKVGNKIREIIGTGFIFHSNGFIATNNHIIEAIKGLESPPGSSQEGWQADAMLFYEMKEGVVPIPLEIIKVGGIRGVIPRGAGIYYGPEAPDLGYVRVKAKGLPKMEIDQETFLEEGLEIATAGYPMGLRALAFDGNLNQVTPFLQRGIISSIFPFPTNTPHGFSINIMARGGMSGSPVFLSTTGNVLGILYANLDDFELSETQGIYRVPTNFSLVVPSHYLKYILEQHIAPLAKEEIEGAKTIEEMLSEKTLVDIINRTVIKPKD